MKKVTFLIMLLTIFSKCLGFIRELVLSYTYGASMITDAYLVAVGIPFLLFDFIVSGILSGYIPLYSQIEYTEGRKNADQFTNTLINVLLFFSTLVLVVGFIFAEPLVKLFAAGFEGDTLELAIQFTRIALFSVYFTGNIAILSGYLQLRDQYIVPALIGIPLNGAIILSIIWSKSNVLILAVGYVAAAFFQLLFLLPFLRKENYRYKPSLHLKNPHIKTLLSIAFPVILGLSVNHLNTLVDRTLASQIAVGGVSALNYATKLNGFVQGIFVMSLSTVMYPMISKMAAKKDREGLKHTVQEVINSINLLIIPSAVGLMVLAVPIVKILFGRGAFSAQALEMTSSALFFYSIGIVGVGLREILSRVFYSLQDTKTPMINAALGVGVNIVLNIVLSKFMGLSGLALATSLSALLTTLLLFSSLRKKIGPFGVKRMASTFLKILLASLLMGGAAKISFVYAASRFSLLVSLLGSVGIAFLIYMLLIYGMKIQEVEQGLQWLREKRQGKPLL